MYLNHVPAISAWARSCPENLARVIQFAGLSARVRFYNVPAEIEGALRGDPGCAFAWKARLMADAWEYREAIWWNCEDIAALATSWEDASDHLVAYLATLHGLGFAKAGFVAQLAYYASGCLDVVNTERLGLDPYVTRGRVNERPVKRETIMRRVRLYNRTVEDAGGTECLWDNWCQAIADRYPEAFPAGPCQVSAWHARCLGSFPEGEDMMDLYERTVPLANEENDL